MENKKNIYWINAAKALCIIFVFLLHCCNYYGVRLGVTNGLFRPFYVNAFFFVSGYLLFWKQLSLPKIDENRSEYVNGCMWMGIILILNVLYGIVISSVLFATLEYIPQKLIKTRQSKQILFFLRPSAD